MSRSTSALPALGKAIVEAINRQSWRNTLPAAREISILKGWTACIVCWGGPLDLSIVEKKYNASWSDKGNRKQEVLRIPIKLWVASKRYTGILRYGLESQDSCITSPLNNGFKLGPVMTAAGFVAKQKVYLKFLGNEVWVIGVKG